MKYDKEYLATKNKKQFVQLVLKKYPHLKKASVTRRYYDVRKKFTKTTKTPIKPRIKKNKKPVKIIKIYVKPPTTKNKKIDVIQLDETAKPNNYKLILLQDMKIYQKKINKQYLMKYGFTIDEINWLIKNGEIQNE